MSGLCDEGKNEEPREGQKMGIAIVAEAYGHAFVARGRLGAIGSEKAIPPGKVKSKIAVVFLNHH